MTIEERDRERAIGKAIAEKNFDVKRNMDTIRLQRLQWMDMRDKYHETISICDRLSVLYSDKWNRWKLVKELRRRHLIPQAHRRRK